jgi:hypothetical protein
MKTINAIAVMLLLASASVDAAPLIFDSEARLPSSEPPPRFRAISRGPGIKVESPRHDGETVKSPFDLKLAFKPHGGAKIDPGKVKIIYLNNPDVNLADRVKPYISENGINFVNAEAPVGKHVIQFVLEDTDGRQSSKVIDLNVVK